MKLQDQVCTFEQAKKLKKLGVNQDSLFSWFGDETHRLMDNCAEGIEFGPNLFITTTEPNNRMEREYRSDTENTNPLAAAFTSAELGVLLPVFQNGGGALEMLIEPNKGVDGCFYTTDNKKKILNKYKTEAEARASMFIYLIESHLLAQPMSDKHEVSGVKCNLCGHKWIAVRPEGLIKLECPNCSNMVHFENSKF